MPWKTTPKRPAPVARGEMSSREVDDLSGSLAGCVREGAAAGAVNRPGEPRRYAPEERLRVALEGEDEQIAAVRVVLDEHVDRPRDRPRGIGGEEEGHRHVAVE